MSASAVEVSEFSVSLLTSHNAAKVLAHDEFDCCIPAQTLEWIALVDAS
jgi:hypothetical protein